MPESFEFVAQAVEGLFGLPCCRRRVGPTRRAVSLGFGAEQFHGNPTLVDSYYGEWEVGTYYAGWRIVQRGRVLCGSDDVVDSTDELNERLAALKIGRPIGIEMLSEFDVRLQLEDELQVDFLGTLGEDDEHVVHIFGPQDLYLEYVVASGWEIGSSAEPASR